MNDRLRIPGGSRSVREVIDPRRRDGSTRQTDSTKHRGHVGRLALRRIAILGNHTPRQCGIATFTADLRNSLADALPLSDCFVVAMNDANQRYAYPKTVRLEIREQSFADYKRASEFVNRSGVDVVSLQHEYGIFGGDAGRHVVEFLRALTVPVVSTLHTILAEPGASHKSVLDDVIRSSARIVVMSQRGAELLRDVYDAPMNRVDVIPHGIPHLPGSEWSKERLGFVRNRMMLTFGLLSPDKGIEHAIDALPSIVERCPDVKYVILGATHPHVRNSNGEVYRRMLEARARDLGMTAHVVFHDRFVSDAVGSPGTELEFAL